jgi:hypothetical protein
MNFFLDDDDGIPLLNSSVHSRWLETTNITNSTGNSTVVSPQDDSAVLRATFVVYGSLLLGMLLTFCYVRQAFPRPYQLRNWVPDVKVRTKVEFLFMTCDCDGVTGVWRFGRCHLRLLTPCYSSHY